MKKFGGSGKSKQCCVQRKCPNAIVKDAEEDMMSDPEMDEDDAATSKKQKDIFVSTPEKRKKRERSVSGKKVAEFLGDPIGETKREIKYSRCRIGDEEFSIGDCVKVVNRENDDDDDVAASLPLIAKIVAFVDDNRDDQCFHAEVFTRSSDTILGTVNCNEIFIERRRITGDELQDIEG